MTVIFLPEHDEMQINLLVFADIKVKAHYYLPCFNCLLYFSWTDQRLRLIHTMQSSFKMCSFIERKFAISY